MDFNPQCMEEQKTRIVIIDDEQDLCFLLSSLLSAQGYEVSSAHSFADGLNALSESRPQWLILDNDLPDAHGWEKTDEILALYPGINIIKISANPDSDRTHLQSNVHYLIKPIHVNSVSALIKNQSYLKDSQGI